MGNDLYIVGGSYDVCLKEYIHPFGFRYCPTKDKWKTIAPIQADRCRFSLNAMGNNFLYAVGGVCELNDNDGDNWAIEIAQSNCERYNASADRWEYLPPLGENRSQHAGVVLGDKLYISGELFIFSTREISVSLIRDYTCVRCIKIELNRNKIAAE